ncbi:3-keto-5-aminohexanoate cleavage protein [Actinoplanes utahensis]|uniref:3-keto-5-aminohexanoate cleavage protein n=1 Tax=Actinoplanes utahensis TaxID=1869 RepID=A0A0A6UMK3_ACTUT|nr:3-keto-5-aminohexanoate cleavage protein [Actinoplanes utahensis]KHD75559.1 hypothetical protein MB27_22360 [Actinoplanes utahensis]GIF32366.1 hypothetical protein Aut01nite_53520 [Actinoplanes utahensis]
MRSPIERIKACLNGGRRPGEHPAVPVTPAELAVQAAGAVAAGAEALHLHPRDHTGAETLHADDVGAAVAAVRRSCPGVPVGVTTGLWISDDVAGRPATVARWAGLPPAARPDFASVNVGEPGFTDLTGLLHRAGIEVEAGVWSVADARTLAGMTSAGPDRILVEIVDGTAETAVATADAVLTCLDEHRVPGPRLLHGENATCWPLITHAGRRGLPTRIGLEDTLTGPDGEPVPDNAALVRAALEIWTAGHG